MKSMQMPIKMQDKQYPSNLNYLLFTGKSYIKNYVKKYVQSSRIDALIERK